MTVYVSGLLLLARSNAQSGNDNIEVQTKAVCRLYMGIGDSQKMKEGAVETDNMRWYRYNMEHFVRTALRKYIC